MQWFIVAFKFDFTSHNKLKIGECLLSVVLFFKCNKISKQHTRHTVIHTYKYYSY